ncbi:hypothetical protein [Microvirga flavescens]|uniref:hypothetical protein n=1 Tax=Microvirga flavescens TaxID=2249811 RepID=UPI000DDABB41|nr:hypothetical protein [Microvirga flavescens]
MGKARPSQLIAAAAAFTLSALWQVHADELKCEGPFAPDTTHARLVQVFGAKNVARKTISDPEGITFKASVLFGKDPARRLEVIWEDEARGRRPARIQFSGNGWSVAGLQVGAPLAVVEAANTQPFNLYGFDWDFGGTVSNWNGGALEKLPGDCALIAMLEADQSLDDETLNKASGDQEFSSQDPVMKAVHPKIMLLGVRYSRK